jgi:hypothetical protein
MLLKYACVAIVTYATTISTFATSRQKLATCLKHKHTFETCMYSHSNVCKHLDETLEYIRLKHLKHRLATWYLDFLIYLQLYAHQCWVISQCLSPWICYFTYAAFSSVKSGHDDLQLSVQWNQSTHASAVTTTRIPDYIVVYSTIYTTGLSDSEQVENKTIEAA